MQLTDEAIDAPVKALAVARETAGIAPERFRVLQPGAVRTLQSHSKSAKPNPRLNNGPRRFAPEVD